MMILLHLQVFFLPEKSKLFHATAFSSRQVKYHLKRVLQFCFYYHQRDKNYFQFANNSNQNKLPQKFRSTFRNWKIDFHHWFETVSWQLVFYQARAMKVDSPG